MGLGMLSTTAERNCALLGEKQTGFVVSSHGHKYLPVTPQSAKWKVSPWLQALLSSEQFPCFSWCSVTL